MRLYGLSGPQDSVGVAGQWGSVARFRWQPSNVTVELLFGAIDGTRVTGPRHDDAAVHWCWTAMHGLEYHDYGGLPVLVPGDGGSATATNTSAGGITCHEHRDALKVTVKGVGYTMAGALRAYAGLCTAQSDACPSGAAAADSIAQLLESVRQIFAETGLAHSAACETLVHVQGKHAAQPMYAAIAVRQGDAEQ